MAENTTCIAISTDGKEIAIITRVGEVTILNADTLEQKSSFKVDARDATGLQYITPSVLILASEAISSWDTSSGKKIKTYSAEKLQPAIALSSNGKELVFGTNESLQRWNLIEDRAIGEYCGVPTQNSIIRYTSDGLLIAIATGNKDWGHTKRFPLT